MRISFAAGVLILGSTRLLAQAPANAPAVEPAPAPPAAAAKPAGPSTDATTSELTAPPAPIVPPEIQDTDIGFSYSLPADWQGLATVQRQLDVPYPTALASRKGDSCVEVDMTARHGNSASVVVVLALPFNCYGQSMTAGDLKNFGLGAAEGFKQSFEIVNQMQGNYSLGSHAVWIERADGTPKDRPENPYTFEIACTVLVKGAACWMTMAADAASLRDFEHQAVTLEGETFDALIPTGDAPAVPATAPKKPS